MQSTRCTVLLCTGAPAACWSITVWCSDPDSLAKGTQNIVWNVGVCNTRPGPNPFLVLRGLKTPAPSGKRKISPHSHSSHWENYKRKVLFLTFISMRNFPKQVNPLGDRGGCGNGLPALGLSGGLSMAHLLEPPMSAQPIPAASSWISHFCGCKSNPGATAPFYTLPSTACLFLAVGARGPHRRKGQAVTVLSKGRSSVCTGTCWDCMEIQAIEMHTSLCLQTNCRVCLKKKGPVEVRFSLGDKEEGEQKG